MKHCARSSILENHTVGAPDIIQNLHGTSREIRSTKGDGACAIHSVFGDDVSGEFVKANARAFLLEEFGDSAEIFSSRLQDPALFQNVQDVLWKGLLKPLTGYR